MDVRDLKSIGKDIIEKEERGKKEVLLELLLTKSLFVNLAYLPGKLINE